MISYLFRLVEGSSMEEAEEELCALGLEHVYCVEEDEMGEVLIGGMCEERLELEALKFSVLAEEKQVKGVDWSEQWSLFAEDFRDGKAHIDLSRFGGKGTLLLYPGPGFGDLSHPTTYLMLELMEGRVGGESVVDIGCGSGILTLAALHLGAEKAWGMDIDPDAVEHARKNGELNGLKAEFSLELPEGENCILLMNMIVPEQKMVMAEGKRLNGLAKMWIVSGILDEQRIDYLKLAKKWGWKLVEERKKEGWVGMVFCSLN